MIQEVNVSVDFSDNAGGIRLRWEPGPEGDALVREIVFDFVTKLLTAGASEGE